MTLFDLITALTGSNAIEMEFKKKRREGWGRGSETFIFVRVHSLGSLECEHSNHTSDNTQATHVSTAANRRIDGL